MNETGADSNTNESNTNESNTNDKIKELSSVEIRSSRARIYCLTVVGEIEGHIISPPTVKVTKYEHIIPELVRVEEDSEVDALMILLNTVGGDVEAGLAIAELISSMKKPTVSLVLGGGHSIGVPLAVSTDFSLIVPSATMTVHPIRTTGTTITAPQTFEQMYKLQDRLISFVTKHSGIKEKKLREMMLDPGNISNDMGTVLFGEEAVECGLINKTGGLADAISHINSLVESGK